MIVIKIGSYGIDEKCLNFIYRKKEYWFNAYCGDLERDISEWFEEDDIEL